MYFLEIFLEKGVNWYAESLFLEYLRDLVICSVNDSLSFVI